MKVFSNRLQIFRWKSTSSLGHKFTNVSQLNMFIF